MVVAPRTLKAEPSEQRDGARAPGGDSERLLEKISSRDWHFGRRDRGFKGHSVSFAYQHKDA
jgi:hypothetical protein